MSNATCRRASAISIVVAATMFLMATRAADAAWVPITITSTHVGQSALVWEQIFKVPGTGAVAA